MDIESLGTPYGVGSFGVGCGRRSDLTVSGAYAWHRNRGAFTQRNVYFYTTQIGIMTL